MNEETLDRIIRELDDQEKLRRVERAIEEREIPVEHILRMDFEEKKISAALLESLHDAYTPENPLSGVLTYGSPSTVGITAANYSKPDTFYIHVPSWVRIHRAPFHEFGNSLFGLAYTGTGDVHIREDLDGTQFSEVLFHEVLHQLYPNIHEQEIRSMVLARMGSAAQIHTFLARP